MSLDSVPFGDKSRRATLRRTGVIVTSAILFRLMNSWFNRMIDRATLLSRCSSVMSGGRR